MKNKRNKKRKSDKRKRGEKEEAEDDIMGSVQTAFIHQSCA